MSEKPEAEPNLTEAGARRRAAERDRLAAALKANLAKRKAQTRARGAGDPPPQGEGDDGAS